MTDRTFKRHLCLRADVPEWRDYSASLPSVNEHSYEPCIHVVRVVVSNTHEYLVTEFDGCFTNTFIGLGLSSRAGSAPAWLSRRSRCGARIAELGGSDLDAKAVSSGGPRHGRFWQREVGDLCA